MSTLASRLALAAIAATALASFLACSSGAPATTVDTRPIILGGGGEDSGAAAADSAAPSSGDDASSPTSASDGGDAGSPVMADAGDAAPGDGGVDAGRILDAGDASDARDAASDLDTGSDAAPDTGTVVDAGVDSGVDAASIWIWACTVDYAFPPPVSYLFCGPPPGGEPTTVVCGDQTGAPPPDADAGACVDGEPVGGNPIGTLPGPITPCLGTNACSVYRGGVWTVGTVSED